MSESNSVSDTNQSVGDQDQQNSADSVEQKVAYQTYQRTLDEAKKAKAAAKALQDQLQKINEEKMLAEGKKDELLAQKDAELKDAIEALNRMKAETIVSKVHSKVAEVALKFGAYDASDVIKNVAIKDLGIDEEGSLDVKVLESKVDEIRKTKPYLFKSEKAQVVDGNPVLKPQSLNKDSIKNLSTKELLELYGKI